MSKRIILGSIMAGCLMMVEGVCFGEPFLIQGSRPLAMGGAFVAVAEDATASYWNPAGLAKQQKRFDVEIPFYVDYAATGDIVKKLDDVGKIGYDTITKKANERQYGTAPIGTTSVQSFFKLLDGLDRMD